MRRFPRKNGFPRRNEALEAELQADYDALPDLPYTGHTAQIDNVLSAIETGGRPFIDGVSGRRTIEMITAIYKSGFEGRTVALPLAPDDPFYTVEGILKNVRHFYEKSASVENLADAGITVGGEGNDAPVTRSICERERKSLWIPHFKPWTA